MLVIGRHFRLSEYIAACTAHRSDVISDITHIEDVIDSGGVNKPIMLRVKTIKIPVLYPARSSVEITFYPVRDYTDMNTEWNIDTILLNCSRMESYYMSEMKQLTKWIDHVKNWHASERSLVRLYVSCDEISNMTDYDIVISEDIISNVIGDPISMLSTIVKTHARAPYFVPIIYVPRQDALRQITIGIVLYDTVHYTFDDVVNNVLPGNKSFSYKIPPSCTDANQQYAVNTISGIMLITFVQDDGTLDRTTY